MHDNKIVGFKVSNWNGEDLLSEGEYAKHPTLGIWFCCSPNGHMGNLSRHGIVENEDGTITVTPSIGIGHNNELWHGYLEHGIWRDC